MCNNLRQASAILVVIFVLGAPQSARAEEIRVLCYNIHYGQGVDGKYDLDRLAQVINAAKPDLVALQEVDVVVKRSGRVHQAQELAKLTKMSVRYGPTQHYQGGLYGNAVLTRLPIQDVAIQPLPYTDSTPERVTYPRGAIAVTVRTPNGVSLRFVSTHFQHNLAEDRLAEAKAINRLFAPAKSSDGSSLLTILAGDMNATPDSAPIAELKRHWVSTHKEPATPTAPSVNPRSRIDYIFYARNRGVKVREQQVIEESMASDHRPVFAVLELPASGE